MAKLASSVESITFGERTLLLVNLVALLVRFFFHYEATFFMEVFAILLALLYFPFGFYSIGKPGKQYNYVIPIILGLVYAVGEISLLISAVNIGSYHYPLIADFFVLLAAIICLMFRMHRDKYPSVFINTQYLRIGYLYCAGSLFCSNLRLHNCPRLLICS